MELFRNTNFDFIGNRRIAFVISIIFIIAGIVSLIVRGGMRYGIDFEGGTLVEMKFARDIRIEDIRKTLKKINLSESIIQKFGAENEIIIRAHDSKLSEKEASQIDKKIEACLKEEYDKINPLVIQRVEYVGPAVGKDLTNDTLMALLISWIGILIYVSWRFEFRYAVPSVIALVHDVMVTVGILSMLNKEMTIQIVAALLTLIGYSINDTIVIYDRIRDELPALRRKNIPLEEIFNRSINNTLSRTTITSLTTLLSILAILLFGGEVLRDFALALFVGVITGTYSSIFVAAPLIIEWDHLSPKKRDKK